MARGRKTKASSKRQTITMHRRTTRANPNNGNDEVVTDDNNNGNNSTVGPSSGNIVSLNSDNNVGASNNSIGHNVQHNMSNSTTSANNNSTILQTELDSIRSTLQTIQTQLQEKDSSSHNTRPPRVSHLKTSDIRIPRYEGAHESKTPYDFLQELEKYGMALGYTNRELLLQVVPHTLGDEAYRWYLFQGHKIQDWQTFKAALRREFQPADYEVGLRRELEERSQGCHEPLTSYIRVINDFYDRLSPYAPEKERI